MTTEQPAEGKLLQSAMKRAGLSARNAASRAGISEGRWRQIVKGAQSAGQGNAIPVVGPADTVARMAYAVRATPEELRAAGRDDAAVVLEGILASGPGVTATTSAIDRLLSLRAELDSVIEQLRGTEGADPQV